MHRRFRAYQHTMHADSAEQAMGLLLGDSVLRIPMPEPVMDRWMAEAEASGFPLDQWVAQRVEGYLANRAYAGEVRAALNELVALKRQLAMANAALAAHQAGPLGERPPAGDR